MKSKEYIYNYVDRVRFAEGSFPDYKCPSRGSGWRQNKSVSHLDLATSCHSAASGLNHWSSSQQSRHQLRHSRSLDYNHIDRCKDALDIAEYYWRLDHTDPEIYDEEDEEILEPEHNGGSSGAQLKYVSEHHLTQHYRDFKCAEDNYHHSANSSYPAPQQQQPLPQQQRQLSTSSPGIQQHQSSAGTIPPQAFEFASDSCSLRRSRSLAVIREETFSDLQINSSSDSRRSQLIPRARLVHRGYFRERDRLICSNNKHHHHHHSSREKLTNCSSGASGSAAPLGTGSSAASVEADEQSNESVAETCDSHQHQLQLQHYQQQQLQKSHQAQQQQQQQQQQQPQLHYHPLYHETQQGASSASVAANDYYDHLKRLDKLALGLVAEQLHPWHNDKSDLESLNSDYFKNSLHQSHEHKQQHYEIEALEQAVSLLAQDKPRIYQSRRQKRTVSDKSPKLTNSAGASGGESCPETSQSSVFPETTTSNSEDQSDSGSLSEQEYDITKIEEIYQKTHIEGDDESYEIISLTTTTRTRFETTEDEAEDNEKDHHHSERHLDECDCRRDDTEEESNQHTTTDTEVEGTLKRSRAVSENLQKIIAYDSVYLSSEESSDSTLVDVEHCDTSLEVASVCTCIDEVETLLHISIEDAIYEPKAKQHKIEIECNQQEAGDYQKPLGFVETINTKIEILQPETTCDETESDEFSPIYTQILKVEHTPCIGIQSVTTSPVTATTTVSSCTTAVGVTSSAASKPKILSVVEKRKLKRYSDSAYSSNLSDSSEKTLYSGNYPTTESYAFSTHLKRQVAEPLYIPLKSNLSDNQFHSLPDVNIGQSLKLCESIDAQLRSSYNLDSYRSLDDSSVEGQLKETTDEAGAPIVESHHYNSNRRKREDIVASEAIYDSIKRFGRAHQKYRQREIKECQLQQQQLPIEDVASDQEIASNILPEETKKELSVQHIGESFAEDIHCKPKSEKPNSVQRTTENIENPEIKKVIPPTPSDCDSHPKEETFPSEIFDSYEKSKEAPILTVENFSQQIERRAKEIRQSGRRNKLQQIEFVNRAKFRLENTLDSCNVATETKEYQRTSSQHPAPFRIVVTDAQDNVIEEESIESQRPSLLLEEKENNNFINLPEESQQRTTHHSDNLLVVKVNKNKIRDKTPTLNHHVSRQSSLKRAPAKPKRQQYPANVASAQLISADQGKHPIPNSPKTKERRVLSNQIYRARPVKVITATDSFRRNKVKQTSSKMSRPQILQVIDNKRKSNVASGNPMPHVESGGNKPSTEGTQVESEYFKKVDAVRCYWSKLAKDDRVEGENEEEERAERQQQQHESKEIEAHQQQQQQETQIDAASQPSIAVETTSVTQNPPEKRHFILGAQKPQATHNTRNPNQSTASVQGDSLAKQHKPDDFSSFMPSIEIVELDGDNKATIVAALPPDANEADALDATEPQFDHIRYKVLKSQQLLRSNVLARNKKEAQFDGLIQYLQEYSFKELLSNNNVVIVEPVRTKIERSSSTSCTHAAHFKNQLICPRAGNEHHTEESANGRKARTTSITSNTSSGLTSAAGGGNGGGGGIKRHFFYQPVRVNRELYEEELPNPDTVRNVRKFFEENILPTPGQGLLTTTTTMTTTTLAKSKNVNNNGNNLPEQTTSPKSRRTRKYRYLTIDTSYGHAGTTALTTSKQQQQQQQQQQHQQKPSTKVSQQSRKWDTASLSSGVSSGDLSSPCECNEADTETVNHRVDSEQINDTKSNDHTTAPGDVDTRHQELQGVHVQDIVKKHNNVGGVYGVGGGKKSRTSATGIPVRSSNLRPRNSIYGYSALHKSGQTNVYRNVYEYHAVRGQLHHDSDGDQAADEDANEDDDDDLFGDIEDDDNELCDTYYVSNDVLRKIRECGSSVTYYGGRVVQSTPPNHPGTKSFESHCNNGQKNANAAPNKANSTSLMPTMLTQTQTMARVREIETCCNASCHQEPANECHHNTNAAKEKNNGSNRMLHKTEDNKRDTMNTQLLPPKAGETMPQGYEDTRMEGGVTFKLVKSNSCSSRLELAGTDADADVDALEEPEETEVVRKIVHQFEASSTHNAGHPGPAGPALTINNQTPLSADNLKSARIPLESAVKQVTVNNHINVADGIPTPFGNEENENETKDDTDRGHYEEMKTYQSEAKDIHLGGGSATSTMASAKVCRNRNVDLAFTFVKQQHSKSLGIKDPENANAKQGQTTDMGKGIDTTYAPLPQTVKHTGKCVTYENTLLPTITTTAIVKDKGPKGQEYQSQKDIKQSLQSQIIVPVEIHCAQDNPIIPKLKQHPTKGISAPSSAQAEAEKCFSTTSSVTSVVDKSVVKHYVANDRSIYEKRKYDDIEFEEFEVYDPTKDFEKLIEEEEAKRANNAALGKDAVSMSLAVEYEDNEKTGQHSGTSTMSSMRTANNSTETETDCYDSLDDKL